MWAWMEYHRYKERCEISDKDDIALLFIFCITWIVLGVIVSSLSSFSLYLSLSVMTMITNLPDNWNDIHQAYLMLNV